MDAPDTNRRNKTEFSVYIGGNIFSFQKVAMNNDEVIFFITHDMKDQRSFFMSNIEGKGWKILYHFLLGKELLLLENDLEEAIRNNGF